MLREYKWSLTFVVLALLAYTAMVLISKKSTDAARSAASVKPTAALIIPTSAPESSQQSN